MRQHKNEKPPLATASYQAAKTNGKSFDFQDNKTEDASSFWQDPKQEGGSSFVSSVPRNAEADTNDDQRSVERCLEGLSPTKINLGNEDDQAEEVGAGRKLKIKTIKEQNLEKQLKKALEQNELLQRQLNSEKKEKKELQRKFLQLSIDKVQLEKKLVYYE